MILSLAVLSCLAEQTLVKPLYKTVVEIRDFYAAKSFYEC